MFITDRTPFWQRVWRIVRTRRLKWDYSMPLYRSENIERIQEETADDSR